MLAWLHHADGQDFTRIPACKEILSRHGPRAMKAVILAGLGSRVSEEATARPQPMVEIAGEPWETWSTGSSS